MSNDSIAIESENWYCSGTNESDTSLRIIRKNQCIKLGIEGCKCKSTKVQISRKLIRYVTGRELQAWLKDKKTDFSQLYFIAVKLAFKIQVGGKNNIFLWIISLSGLSVFFSKYSMSSLL